MELIPFIHSIVSKAKELKDKHTNETNARVNYCCIFSQSQKEYNELIKTVETMGKVTLETAMGPVFHIQPLETVAGTLKLLKIRKPDKTRPEQGDADFTVVNYPEFKKKYLGQDGFRLMDRPNFEMIELVDSDFDVRAYFSNIPLNEQLGV